MQNICYFISDVSKSFNLEWMMKYLDKTKFNVHCVIFYDKETDLELAVKSLNIKVLRLKVGKSKLVINTIKSFFYLRKNKIDIIHCHLFEACLVGLFAGYLARVKKRLHTRHNSTIHHDYHPQAVKYDRFINFLSTKIISISEVVTSVLINLEKVKPEKIVKVFHGFDFDQISQMANSNRIDIKAKYNLDPDKDFYIGSISRFVQYKGVHYLIPAFETILKKIPHAKLILANATGPYTDHIMEQLKKIPADKYIIIPFEPNIYSLINFLKIFVHVPVSKTSEAFGQVYIETMYLGVPGVITNSGIACEISLNGINALTVEYGNIDEISEAVIKLYENKKLYEQIAENSKIIVSKDFGIVQMIKQLETIYGA